MQALPRVSGSVYQRQRQCGMVWYAKWREPDPAKPGHLRQRKKLLGPVAANGGRPQEGYLTRKMAEAVLDAILTDARRGVSDDPIRGRQHTFQPSCDEYLRYIEHDRRRGTTTVRGYKGTIDGHLVPHIGADTPVATITTGQIEDLREKLLATDLSPRSVQKIMVILYGTLKRAKRKGWTTTNPAEDVERVTVRRSGDFSVLTPEEVQAVARVADDKQDATVFVVAAFTGLRMGELRALRWRDLDFTGRSIHVRRNYTHGKEHEPKSGKVRSVPVIDQAAVALDALSRRERFTAPDDLVFCHDLGGFIDDGDLRQRFYSALKRAGLGHKREGDKPMVFHDLRHTFGTLAVKVWELTKVQGYMGHANISTTMIYVHHVPKANDAEALSRLVAQESSATPGEISMTGGDQANREASYGK